LLGEYIIPAVLAFGLLGAFYIARAIKTQDSINLSEEISDQEPEGDSWTGIFVRALKVYLFVMALVFLGEGFQPLIDKYIMALGPNILFWVNMISAILDNATLTAAEISRQMTNIQVTAIIMGLLISGGMLIPGNIPNIISASKLKITSREWAKLGIPFGLVTMAIFYDIIF
jgi:predicted cation transporter